MLSQKMGASGAETKLPLSLTPQVSEQKSSVLLRIQRKETCIGKTDLSDLWQSSPGLDSLLHRKIRHTLTHQCYIVKTKRQGVRNSGKWSISVLRVLRTVAGEALSKEAGKTVFSVAVPTFSRVQNKYKAICNFCHVQQGVHVSCAKKPSETYQNRNVHNKDKTGQQSNIEQYIIRLDQRWYRWIDRFYSSWVVSKDTIFPHNSMLTSFLAQKGEPLFKTRQNEPKTVTDATDTLLLMHDAPSALPTQQLGDSARVDCSMEGYYSD